MRREPAIPVLHPTWSRQGERPPRAARILGIFYTNFRGPKQAAASASLNLGHTIRMALRELWAMHAAFPIFPSTRILTPESGSGTATCFKARQEDGSWWGVPALRLHRSPAS